MRCFFAFLLSEGPWKYCLPYIVAYKGICIRRGSTILSILDADSVHGGTWRLHYTHNLLGKFLSIEKKISHCWMGSNWQWCIFCSALTIQQPAVQCPHHHHRKSCHLPEATLALAIPHKHQKIKPYQNHISPYQNMISNHKPNSSTAFVSLRKAFKEVTPWGTDGNVSPQGFLTVPGAIQVQVPAESPCETMHDSLSINCKPESLLM